VVWFTDSDLRALAEHRSYERGLGYVGVVTGIGELPGGVVATVRGGAPYRVRLTGADGGVLDGDCSCPHGQDGFFCKHCVAVGLRMLADGQAAPVKTGRGKVDVRGFLAGMDHAALVELLWSQAGEDAELFRRLQLLAATAAGSPDLTLLEGQVERLRVDWLEYGAGRAYATSARTVLEALERLLPVHAEALQPLLRKAIAVIGAAADASEDDSAEVADVAYGAWNAYLAACAVAPPDPVELAGWFAGLQLNGPDSLGIGIGEITELLGDTGLDAYRQRLARSGGNQLRAHTLQEELLLATGAVDALVALWAQDLSGPYRYLQIAGLLHAEGRLAEAVTWSERGVAAAGGASDPRYTQLIDLLAVFYAEAGRDADVLPLRERHFMAAATEAAYRALKVVAEPASAWQELRPRVHARLWERAETQAWGAADTLVTVLSDDGERARAWDAVRRFHCQERTLLDVAGWRGETHPQDAVALYRPMVDVAIARANNDGYTHATQLLLRIRALTAGDEFATDLTTLKQTHRRKRNFLAELARNGL
jgi:uncharacterized Zn finger protein